MKVNQIVSEHKKGVRAKIYNKKATTKAQGPVPLYGPEKQEAKLTPYKAPKAKAVMEADAPIAPGTALGTVEKVDPATKQATIKTTAGDETQVGFDQTSKIDNNTIAVPPPATNPQDMVGDKVVAKQVGEAGADNTNTITVKNVNGALFASDGDPIELTSTRREVDQSYISDPVNATNRIGYIDFNGTKYPALNTGHKWKVGPKVFQILNANPTAAGSAIRVKESRNTSDAKFKTDLDAMLTIAGLK